jgi:hypothetical protein
MTRGAGTSHAGQWQGSAEAAIGRLPVNGPQAAH